MDCVRPRDVLLLLGMMFVCSVETSMAGGCRECSLHRYPFLAAPVYQCRGCCYSKAFPTPHSTLRTMAQPKPITSQACCCVASDSHEVDVWVGGFTARVKNQTSCHCGICKYQKLSSG
ncbi:hypothetical protein NL108_013209 [Boleophthalmus pectinirostris]|uniref:glycoprotein hormones alpha chain-like n=1 Tax=Boleophthalmus pectinirostris TaxID=150288 RepID=UPI000A1C437E|nr:glycoprotein hormones alpha chain-like [Boleophthalmus pectinirostris]KAJ0063165.1 hypothetical protein NL108_013209 [Boleophthalmus pectinirostris]